MPRCAYAWDVGSIADGQGSMGLGDPARPTGGAPKPPWSFDLPDSTLSSNPKIEINLVGGDVEP